MLRARGMTAAEAELDRVLIEEARAYLLEKLGQIQSINKDEAINILSKQITPDTSIPEFNIERLFRGLVGSAGNRNMMPKVVFRSTAAEWPDGYKEVFCDFKPKEFLDRYSSGDALFEEIQEKLRPNIQRALTKRSLWPLFCRSAISAAKFVVQFDTADDFRDWANRFRGDERSLIGLPLVIAAEVVGVQFALACDFLKELGYTEFGKSDVHVKDILTGCALCDSKEDIQIFKAIQRIAKNANCSNYEADKLVWLIGSRDFYKFGLTVDTSKTEFIDRFREQYH